MTSGHIDSRSANQIPGSPKIRGSLFTDAEADDFSQVPAVYEFSGRRAAPVDPAMDPNRPGGNPPGINV